MLVDLPSRGTLYFINGTQIVAPRTNIPTTMEMAQPIYQVRYRPPWDVTSQGTDTVASIAIEAIDGKTHDIVRSTAAIIVQVSTNISRSTPANDRITLLLESQSPPNSHINSIQHHLQSIYAVKSNGSFQ